VFPVLERDDAVLVSNVDQARDELIALACAFQRFNIVGIREAVDFLQLDNQLLGTVADPTRVFAP
jgi:hypothetical protein